MKENLIFIDLEANQEMAKKRQIFNRLLQLLACKINLKNTIEWFNHYCFYDKKNNGEIESLIQKKAIFFKKQKYTEKEVYLEFLEFSKNSICYTFGNYDETVLNDVAKNNYINKKVKAIDLQEFIKKKFRLIVLLRYHHYVNH